MKKLIIILMCVLFASVAWAEPPEPAEAEETAKPVSVIPEELKKCPTLGQIPDCLKCHTIPNFKIIEGDLFETKDPPYGTEYRVDTDGTVIGYHEITGIDPDAVEKALRYFAQDPAIHRVVFNVFSPGGSVFHAWKMITIMERYYNRFEIQTRCDSAAFSAGFLVYLAGETRLASRHANFMGHELAGWAMFVTMTPAGLKEDAKRFEKWQKQINNWIAERSHVDVKIINEKCEFKEWWFDGIEALEFGVATGVLK